MTTSDLAHFWARVKKSDSCWEWTGANNGGYGRMEVAGKLTYAHRLAWELANGSGPGDLCVCHRCDNPACVRPDHLFLGTFADNMGDKISKGRQSRGLAHGAVNRGKTHCPQGHEYTAENISLSGGDRKCKACMRERARQRRAHVVAS